MKLITMSSTKNLLLFIVMLLLSVPTFAQAPANDECSAAIDIPVNTNTTCYTFITGTTVGAGPTTAMPGCSGVADDEVWYKFTTISSTTHTITITPTAANGINDVNFEVFNGDCSTLNLLSCRNTTTGASAEAAGIISGTGNTFYLRVYSNSGLTVDQGDFEICIHPEFNILQSNILNNASFENPVQSSMGEHILTSIPEWSFPAFLQPDLIRVDGTGYGDGPDTARIGNQYIELVGGDGYLTQRFLLTGLTTINYGGWFSRRQAAANGFESYLQIFSENSGELVSSSDTVNIDATEGQQLWKLAHNTVTLPSGYYNFSIFLADSINFDGAFVTPVDPAAPAISIAATASTICANDYISFTATASNVSGAFTYQWVKNGVNIIDSVNNFYGSNALANNDAISCNLIYTDGNGMSQTIGSNTIVVNINPDCYCIPAGDDIFYGITNVTVNGVSNTSVNNNSLDLYTDYYDSAISFNAAQATVVSFNINTPIGETYKRIWIDFNDDRDFDDAGELLFASTNKSISSVNGSFFIPANVPTGNHRLRVRSVQPPVTGACDPGNGETEDYRIQIFPGTACSGTPSSSLATASQFVVCAGGSTSLTAYANGLGISYQWQQSTSANSGFADTAGVIGPNFTTGSITANSYYRCVFTCASNGESGISPVLAITISNIPVNDNICDAITLTQFVYDSTNTTCATATEPNFPGSGVCSLPNNTVWYKITPAVTDTLRLMLTRIPGDPYPIDAWVSIFKASGNCPNISLTPVSPNQFNCLRANLRNQDSIIVRSGVAFGLPPSVTAILDADTTYYIRIDGYIESYGAFKITSLNPTVPINSWTGTANNQWEDINNWSNHQLPDATTDVIINSNAIHFPVINSNVTVRSLKVNGGSVQVSAGKTLNILH